MGMLAAGPHRPAPAALMVIFRCKYWPDSAGCSLPFHGLSGKRRVGRTNSALSTKTRSIPIGLETATREARRTPPGGPQEKRGVVGIPGGRPKLEQSRTDDRLTNSALSLMNVKAIRWVFASLGLIASDALQTLVACELIATPFDRRLGIRQSNLTLETVLADGFRIEPVRIPLVKVERTRAFPVKRQ